MSTISRLNYPSVFSIAVTHALFLPRQFIILQVSKLQGRCHLSVGSASSFHTLLSARGKPVTGLEMWEGN